MDTFDIYRRTHPSEHRSVGGSIRERNVSFQRGPDTLPIYQMLHTLIERCAHEGTIPTEICIKDDLIRGQLNFNMRGISIDEIRFNGGMRDSGRTFNPNESRGRSRREIFMDEYNDIADALRFDNNNHLGNFASGLVLGVDSGEEKKEEKVDKKVQNKLNKIMKFKGN